MNSCYFTLYRAYFNLFNSSNVGKFFWSWIWKGYIEVQEKKKKVVVLCSRHWQNMKLRTFTLQSCSNGKEISYCFAILNLLLFRCSLLLASLKLPNNLILGNLNGALIFSEFEQILAIKMAAIQGIFNKDQQPAKFTSYFTWTRYLLFFGNYPSFFQITWFKTDTETTNGSKLLARRNKFKKYM